MPRKAFAIPANATASAANATIAIAALPCANASRSIVNSLAKVPNGGEPVMAKSPASHSKPLAGRHRMPPPTRAMDFVR